MGSGCNCGRRNDPNIVEPEEERALNQPENNLNNAVENSLVEYMSLEHP